MQCRLYNHPQHPYTRDVVDHVGALGQSTPTAPSSATITSGTATNGTYTGGTAPAPTTPRRRGRPAGALVPTTPPPATPTRTSARTIRPAFWPGESPTAEQIATAASYNACRQATIRANQHAGTPSRIGGFTQGLDIGNTSSSPQPSSTSSHTALGDSPRLSPSPGPPPSPRLSPSLGPPPSSSPPPSPWLRPPTPGLPLITTAGPTGGTGTGIGTSGSSATAPIGVLDKPPPPVPLPSPLWPTDTSFPVSEMPSPRLRPATTAGPVSGTGTGIDISQLFGTAPIGTANKSSSHLDLPSPWWQRLVTFAGPTGDKSPLLVPLRSPWRPNDPSVGPTAKTGFWHSSTSPPSSPPSPWPRSSLSPPPTDGAGTDTGTGTGIDNGTGTGTGAGAGADSDTSESFVTAPSQTPSDQVQTTSGSTGNGGSNNTRGTKRKGRNSQPPSNGSKGSKKSETSKRIITSKGSKDSRDRNATNGQTSNRNSSDKENNPSSGKGGGVVTSSARRSRSTTRSSNQSRRARISHSKARMNELTRRMQMIDRAKIALEDKENADEIFWFRNKPLRDGFQAAVNTDDWSIESDYHATDSERTGSYDSQDAIIFDHLTNGVKPGGQMLRVLIGEEDQYSDDSDTRCVITAARRHEEAEGRRRIREWIITLPKAYRRGARRFVRDELNRPVVESSDEDSRIEEVEEAAEDRRDIVKRLLTRLLVKNPDMASRLPDLLNRYGGWRGKPDKDRDSVIMTILCRALVEDSTLMVDFCVHLIRAKGSPSSLLRMLPRKATYLDGVRTTLTQSLAVAQTQPEDAKLAADIQEALDKLPQ